MHRFSLLFLAIICAAANVAAQDRIQSLPPLLFQSVQLSDCTLLCDRPERIESRASEPLGLSVRTTRAGELAALIGDQIILIDTLHVEGPVNADDFNSMWNSTFNGRLKVLDLGKASVEDGIIPDYALFHIDEQVDWESGIVYGVSLEKLILPYDTQEIGRHAFAYAPALDHIKFPASLKRIGTASFTYCRRLATDPFVLPENLELLGDQAFYGCSSLAGEVILPSSLKAISSAAFYLTHINKINVPPSVEYVGDFAFYGSSLKEIDLPDGCYLDARGCQFYANYELEKAHIPESCEYIPEDIFLYCPNLKSINIPAAVTSIGSGAFEGCRSLECFTSLVLPEGLKTLGMRAFSDNPIKEILFPSTLAYIGAEMFGFGNKLQKIYCKAVAVPECHDWELRPGESPFYGVSKDVEVYIPVGTADLYRNAWGWDYFANFIETDTFPSSSVEGIATDKAYRSGTIYDTYGRKTESPLPGTIYILNGKKFIRK